jgi:RND family efflux transporter MFP subunit
MSTELHSEASGPGLTGAEPSPPRPAETAARAVPPPPATQRIAALVGVVVFLALGALLVARLVQAFDDQARIATEREEAAERGARASEVDVVRPTAATYTPLVVLQGTLEPVQAADLGFEVAGRVARVDVALGQHVDAGDVLVTLDRASLGAASAQSEAAIAVAQANVDMTRDRVALLEGLARSGAAPERELTTARQQLAVAEAQLAQTQASRRTIATTAADHVLRAPFDGVVTRVPSGVGAVAGPGQTLVRVEDLSSLRLRTTVSQSELEALSVGASASIEGREGVTGTITSAVRSLDAQSRRAPVEVVVPNEGERLVANAIARARVIVGAARPALRIPATARRPNGTVLIVGSDGRVEARTIDAQADLDGSWLVASGLSETDRVVLRPATAREGQVVVPVEQRSGDGPAPAQAALEG